MLQQLHLHSIITNGINARILGAGNPVWVGRSGGPPAFEEFISFRAIAADYSGGSIVGEGVTLAPDTGTPVLSGNMVQLDGDDLVGTISSPLNDLSVILAARATGSNNSRDAVITLKDGTKTINIESKTAGEMEGRMRSSNFGFGTSIPSPADAQLITNDLLNTITVFTMKFDGAKAQNTVGAFNSGSTTMSGTEYTVTSLIIGRDGGSNFIPMDFFEVIGLEGADDAAIASAVEYMRNKYSAEGTYYTPVVETPVPLLGDSNTVGIGGDTINERWARRVPKDFSASTFDLQATAGTQASLYGFVSPADDSKIAKSFPTVTQTAATFTDARMCLISFGGNDYGQDVPIGTFGDTTDQTFYGGLHQGSANLAANAPADMLRVFVSIPPRFPEPAANGAGHLLEDYRVAVETHIAAQDPATHILVDLDTAGLVEEDMVSDSNPADTLHYGDNAHAKIAATIRKAIAKHFGIVR